MSDLLVTYDGLSAPPAACAKEAPEPDAKNPTPKDDCSLQIPLIDEADTKSKAHLIRFDRNGKEFFLSKLNSAEELTWVGQHGSLKSILDILRMTESLTLSRDGAGSVNAMQLFLTITQFIVTGKVRFEAGMSFFPEIPGGTGDRFQLASFLLEVFTQNSDEAVKKLLGGLAVLRGEKGNSQDVSNRIDWVTDIIRWKASYLKFRDHFVDEEDLKNGGEKLSEKDQSKVTKVLQLMRQLVVRHAEKQEFRFDKVFADAFVAYQSLRYQKDLKEKGDFCERVKAAMGELGQALPATFLEDCRSAMKLLSLDPDSAVRQSLRENLLGNEASKGISSYIAKEGQDTAMTTDWLKERASYAKAVDLFLQNIKVDLKDPTQKFPKLNLDLPALGLALDTMISQSVLKRREYILTAIALLRRLNAAAGQGAGLRTFYQGQFVEAPLALSKQDQTLLGKMQKDMETRLALSEEKSERWLPIAEGATCLAGIGGLTATESLGTFDYHPKLGFTLGITSAGLAGAGCSSLLSHYLLPKTGKVHNRYMWEGLIGLGGGLLASGIYLWLRGSKFNAGDPTRYPTDEYGP